ncbi:hypothetical protein RIF29_34428 [Crotalaria pallida]|uniref:MBD domain-containing protein n=1 Tax=Crotalaria pallida TaxID=3830 RepID=A0AAN9HUN9_CROPI
MLSAIIVFSERCLQPQSCSSCSIGVQPQALLFHLPDTMFSSVYYHSPSNKQFRSKPEVVQFVLKETCPLEVPTTKMKAHYNGRKNSSKPWKTRKIGIKERRKGGHVVKQQVVVDKGVVSSHVVETSQCTHPVQHIGVSHLAETTLSNRLDDVGSINARPAESAPTEHTYETDVSDSVNATTIGDAVEGNQDPSGASMIDTNMYTYHEELPINGLMSTGEVLNDFSVAFLIFRR